MRVFVATGDVTRPVPHSKSAPVGPLALYVARAPKRAGCHHLGRDYLSAVRVGFNVYTAQTPARSMCISSAGNRISGVIRMATSPMACIP